MNTSLFPDVNVWLALSHRIHPQHHAAFAWSETIGNVRPIGFCRFTQLGLLRLLTQRSAMGAEVMTQRTAWTVYESFYRNPNTSLFEEPAGLDRRFRILTDRDEVSPKLWADGYLAAFAEAASLTLVTFDKSLSRRVRGSLLLGG